MHAGIGGMEVGPQQQVDGGCWQQLLVQMVAPSSMSGMRWGPVGQLVLAVSADGSGMCGEAMVLSSGRMTCGPGTAWAGGSCLVTLRGAGTMADGGSTAVSGEGVSGAGVASTLRSGRLMGLFAACRDGGSLVLIVGMALVVPWSTLIRVCRTSVWASLSGARGELGDGFCNAWEMLVMPARMRSRDEALGTGVLVGSHVRVSQMHCTWGSVAHTV